MTNKAAHTIENLVIVGDVSEVTGFCLKGNHIETTITLNPLETIQVKTDLQVGMGIMDYRIVAHDQEENWYSYGPARYVLLGIFPINIPDE